MLEDKPYSAVVSLHNWTILHDGEEYRYVWCANWKIQTDKQMPIEGFRSSEHWQLIALYEDKPVMIIPGCQVTGFTICNECPFVKRLFSIDSWMKLD